MSEPKTTAQELAIDEVLNGKHPRTFKDVITFSLCVGPLMGAEKRMYDNVKDFMSQKFQVAMLERPELETYYLELWDSIFGNRFKEKPKTIEEFKALSDKT
jgi:hypothetical protein